MEQLTEEQLNQLALLIIHMARTGVGTDACLKHGCLPLPVHFYSPVPDIEDLERRNWFDRESPLRGIDWRLDEQLALLAKLGGMFGNECDWPAENTCRPMKFYTENQSFSFGCAASTHAILRYFQPKHVIEIGSGYSSLIISGALQRNSRSDGQYSIVDPYPQPWISQIPMLTNLHNTRVELSDEHLFRKLRNGDVLFIDSGHTVRTGSDVNFLILDILPLLAQGVIVHFHDIHLPHDYAKVYFTNPAFRNFWTEAYLLQAFLCFNHEYSVQLAMGYIMGHHIENFITSFPHYNPVVHKALSGSFWIRRNIRSLEHDLK
jgi:hypothetical protein